MKTYADLPHLSPAQWFTAYKRILQLPQWDQVAEAIDVSTEWIRVIRRKDGVAGEDVAIRLAKGLGIPPEIVVSDFALHTAMAAERHAAVEMWRSIRFRVTDDSPPAELIAALEAVAKEARENVYKKVASTAAGVLILLGLVGGITPPDARAALPESPAQIHGLYIMSNAIRRLASRVRRFLASPNWLRPPRSYPYQRPAVC